MKRLLAGELILSFVPSAEQRLWRTLMRTQYRLRCNQVQLQNRLLALLEEAHLKLSSLISDLLGLSGRHMSMAIADGERDPAAVAAQAEHRLRATPEQLCDALNAWRELHPLYRRLLKTALEDWRRTETEINKLGQEMATLLAAHQEQVQRLAELPGLGVDSAACRWSKGGTADPRNGGRRYAVRRCSEKRGKSPDPRAQAFAVGWGGPSL